MFSYSITLINKSVSHSCMTQFQPIINHTKCYFGLLLFFFLPKYCQWNIVGLCCFLSANSRSKSQSGGNTAGSLWTSFTAVWHQPTEQTEAGPQETPRSVQASLFYWEQHIPALSLVIAGVSLKHLASSVTKIHFFQKHCYVQGECYNGSQI